MPNQLRWVEKNSDEKEEWRRPEVDRIYAQPKQEDTLKVEP